MQLSSCRLDEVLPESTIDLESPGGKHNLLTAEAAGPLKMDTELAAHQRVSNQLDDTAFWSLLEKKMTESICGLSSNRGARHKTRTTSAATLCRTTLCGRRIIKSLSSRHILLSLRCRTLQASAGAVLGGAASPPNAAITAAVPTAAAAAVARIRRGRRSHALRAPRSSVRAVVPQPRELMSLYLESLSRISSCLP